MRQIANDTLRKIQNDIEPIDKATTIYNNIVSSKATGVESAEQLEIAITHTLNGLQELMDTHKDVQSDILEIEKLRSQIGESIAVVACSHLLNLLNLHEVTKPKTLFNREMIYKIIIDGYDDGIKEIGMEKYCYDFSYIYERYKK